MSHYEIAEAFDHAGITHDAFRRQSVGPCLDRGLLSGFRWRIGGSGMFCEWRIERERRLRRSDCRPITLP